MKRFAALVMMLFLFACDREGPGERLGEGIDEAIEDIGDAGETAGERVEEAVDDVQDAAEDLGDDLRTD